MILYGDNTVARRCGHILHRYNERRCADNAPRILIPRWLGCAEALEPKQCHFLLAIWPRATSQHSLRPTSAVDGEIQARITTRSFERSV